MPYNRSRLIFGCSIVLLAAWSMPLVGADLTARPIHLHTRLEWPQTDQEAHVANRLPKREIQTLVGSALGSPANDMPNFGDFRFARLGTSEVCLVAEWGLRYAAEEEVICPAGPGAYWDTSLSDYAPAPLAWKVPDLNGDGNHVVVSSNRVVGSSTTGPLPVFWYELYSFQDGKPHDVSSAFPEFYRAEVLPRLWQFEGLVNYLFAAHPLTSPAEYTRDVLSFTQLKCERRILGNQKAGLEQGIAWTKSDYTNVQGLGVDTLTDIRDPRSVEALRRLGSSTKNVSICAGVVAGLAALAGKSTPEDEIAKCRVVKSEPPRLLQ